MSELKHTPEPWEVVYVNPHIVLTPEPADIGTGRKYVAVGGGNNEENAKRIVTCVNACVGIDNATLEMEGSIAEIIQSKREEIATLKAEVERLLEEKSSWERVAFKLGAETRASEAEKKVQWENACTFKDIADRETKRAETAEALVRELLDEAMLCLNGIRNSAPEAYSYIASEGIKNLNALAKAKKDQPTSPGDQD